MRRLWAACACMGALAGGAAADPPAPAPRARVDLQRLAHSAEEPGEWLTTGRDFSGAYYSPLADINTKTVGRLGFAWEYRLGTRRGLAATPLVVDGVLYAAGSWGRVEALDAETGRALWHFDPQVDGQFARNTQNDVVNRGLIAWQGRIYVLATDCRLYALDARSGALIWQVPTLVRREGYACSGAPQLAGDVIVVGNAGADSSPGVVRGYVSAFDPETGRLRWRFYTVPKAGDPAPTPELQRAAQTWNLRDKSEGGGTVWNGMAYDPTLKLLYLGTANAAPYGAPRDAAGHRTDNLYTASIIAVHADTGRMAWYFQPTPGDRWDYDATATLVLADLRIGTRLRHTLLQANKNGFFYVLDRETGVPVSAAPFVYVNWTRGLDAHFRPQVSAEADYHGGAKLIYPSVQGAHSWPPMAFSPQTGLVYIPSIDAPSYLIDLRHNPGASLRFVDAATTEVAYVVPDRTFDPAYWRALVGPLPRAPAANPQTGRALVRSSIKAWDPVKQQLVWERETSSGYMLVDGGTLATAGHLVLAGREDGALIAYDAGSGAVLKVLNTGTPIMAAPMAYAVHGTQYIAVMAAHGGGYLGSFAGTAAMQYVNDARILAFRLDGAAQVPRPQLRNEPPRRPPPAAPGSVRLRETGARLFATWCARCHSLGVPGVTPDLSRLGNGIEQLEVFEAIVLKGAFVARGMARFDDVLSGEDARALHAWLLDQARELYSAQRPAAAH